MVHRLRVALPILAVLLSIACASHAGDDPSLWDRSKIKSPPLPEIKLPPVDRVVLPNGMVLYILEDHEFPVVQGRVLVRAGSMLDPKEKTGLAGMTGTVLRTGGSAKYPGDDLDRRLEGIGATVEFSLDQFNGIGNFWALKENAPEVLDIVADLLRRPAFPEEKLDLAKSEMRRGIAERNDDPFSILVRESSRLIWGKDHPYAAVPEYATVDAVTRQDLVDFHRQWFFPDRIYMTLWGDFDAKQIRAQVEKLFSDWQPSGAAPPRQPEIPAIVPGGKLAYAEKDGMTNAWIIEGHLGVKADNPDYAAMNVLGEILGGGFASRLVNEIRTKRGLAYMAGSVSGTDIARPGLFFGYAGTRADSALSVVKLMQKEITRITEEPVSDVRTHTCEGRDPELLRIQVRIEGADRRADELSRLLRIPGRLHGKLSRDGPQTDRAGSAGRREAADPPGRSANPDRRQREGLRPTDEQPGAAHRKGRSHHSGTGIQGADSRRDPAEPRRGHAPPRSGGGRDGRAGVGVDPKHHAGPGA